jgi:hypothetical protein
VIDIKELDVFEDIIGVSKKVSVSNLIGNYKTIKCVVCLAPATLYDGHVVMDDCKTIVAGWCYDHLWANRFELFNRGGCWDKWRLEYGLTRYVDRP